MNNQKLFWVMAACVVTIWMFGSAARATLSIDFDTPTYSLGDLNGQDGWSSAGFTIIDGANAYSGQSTDVPTGVNYHATHSAGVSYSTGPVVVDFKYFYYTGTSGCMTLRDGATRFLTFGGLGTDWYAWTSTGTGGGTVAGGGGSPRWLDLRMVLDLDNDTADLQWKELASGTYLTAFDDVAITTGATFDGVELDSEKVAMRIDELAIDVTPGDVNQDGFVGGADITAVIHNWGMSSPTWSHGDVWDSVGAQPGSDGTIDQDDYDEVAGLLGTVYLPPEPGEPIAIPEPAALGLLLLGGLTLIGRRY